MRIEKLDIEKHQEWNRMADNYTGLVTIAHNPILGSIIEKTFGFRDESLVLYDKDKVIGMFPCCRVGSKIVSIPHFSYGGILLADGYNEEEAYSKVLDYFDSEFEIRSFQEVSENNNSSKVSAFLRLQTSEDKQMDLFSRSKRNEIRKGVKEGVETKIGGVDLLEDFYQVYSDIMHKLGSPVLTRYWFLNILKQYKYGEAKLFVNYFNDIPVSSSIIMSYRKFVEVPWAASLWEYSKYGANNLLYWEMISYSIRNNYDIFSFGRCTEGSGSHRFKKKWGTEDKRLYFNFSRPKNVNIKKFDFLANLWSKLPKVAADKLGPYFSKRVY